MATSTRKKATTKKRAAKKKTTAKKRTTRKKAAIGKGKAKRKAKKTEKVKFPLVTPKGFLSFPYLTRPDEGKTYSDGKYKADLIVRKEDMETPAGQALMDTLCACADHHFGEEGHTLGDFKNPIADMDAEDGVQERFPGCVRIRCKSDYAPRIIGPDKTDLKEAQAEKIKGGDWARLGGQAYGWSQGDGGVSIALTTVQYIQEGEALGGGNQEVLELFEEEEVEVEDFEDDYDDDEGEDDYDEDEEFDFED